jgi:hypothetical protein
MANQLSLQEHPKIKTLTLRMYVTPTLKEEHDNVKNPDNHHQSQHTQVASKQSVR